MSRELLFSRAENEALRQEMLIDGHHVGVSCVHPGGVKTQIARSGRYGPGTDGTELADRFDQIARTSPESAARTILRGVERGRPRIIVGADAVALDVMQRYHISGVPVVDEDGHLVGIITNRDLRFETRFDLPVSQVMTPQPLVTVPVGTTLDQAKAVLQEHRIEKLLVIDEDKHLKGLITVKDIQKAIKYPTAAKDDLGRLRVAAAIGAVAAAA